MITQRHSDKLPALNRPQAGIRLSPVVYLRRNPRIAADLAARSAVLAAGIGFLQWPLVAIGLILLIWPTRQFLRVRLMLRKGSPSAAKLVSLDPPLLACVAEMSYVANCSKTVLRVEPVDLAYELPGLERGDRLAVIVKASDGTLQVADRLDILLVSSVSDAEREPILEAVPEWHWDDLEDGLFRLSQPYRVGLFELTR